MRFDSSKLSVNGKKLETACSKNVRNCFNCRKSLSFSWWAYHISKRGCPFHIWLTQNIKSKIKLTEKWEKEKTQQRDYNRFACSITVKKLPGACFRYTFWYYYSQSNILLFLHFSFLKGSGQTKNLK